MKTLKTLSLNRETLQQLTPEQAEAAAGGLVTKLCQTLWPTCGGSVCYHCF